MYEATNSTDTPPMAQRLADAITDLDSRADIAMHRALALAEAAATRATKAALLDMVLDRLNDEAERR